MDEALAFLEKEIRAFENILAELDGKKPPHAELIEPDSAKNKYKNQIISIKDDDSVRTPPPKLTIKSEKPSAEKPKIAPKPKTPISESAPNFIMAARSNLKPVMKPVSPSTDESADDQTNGGKTGSLTNGGGFTSDGRPKVPPKPKLRNSMSAVTVPKPPTMAAETSFDDETVPPPSPGEPEDGTEV